MKNTKTIDKFNEYAINYLKLQNKECSKLYDSVIYSVDSQAKRFRPSLMFAFSNALDVSDEAVFDLALAVELLHTYTLIHDDLPCLDDDVLRRGKKCNHLVYGEDYALLAGDVLQSLAFECIFNAISKGCDPMVLKYFSKFCIEVVEGQSIDIDEDYKTSVLELEKVHNLKTGALIKFAIIAPLFVKKEYFLLDVLLNVGHEFGLIFQIKDDILDYTATDTQLGKSGSDYENNKKTYVSFLGVEASQILLEKKVSTIKKLLADFKLYTREIQKICEFSLNREK